MAQAVHDTQVAIVGAGPVGLGLALELSRRGIACHVLERSIALHRIPKGQNLTQRSGEHLRAWGIDAEVAAASPIPAAFGNAGLVAYGTLLGPYTYDWHRRAAVGAYYFGKPARLPQYTLEQVMRARAAHGPGLTLELGATATEVTQDADGVTLGYTDAEGRARRLRAAYAVGCDGARSMLRQAAGIDQDIDRHGRRMTLLVFRSTELHGLLERYPGRSFFKLLNPEHDGYWQFLGRVDLDGGWFYHAPVPAEATAENFDFRAHLHAAVGAEFAVEFDYVGFWDLQIALARDYRAGRLFIAGDAAHNHPPYGGYGVNTGLEDARNLGWKLAATLAGWGGPGLLDSYGAERRPVFASTSDDFILRMIEEDRAFCRAFSPACDRPAFEAEWQRRAAEGDSGVTGFLPHYAGSPLVFGRPGAVSGATGTHRIAAEPGYHLAPPPLADGRDLWNRLGAGYTLLNLTGSKAAGAGFRQAADALGLPLDIVALAEPEMRAAYGAGLILVRPDHFVAWAGDATDGQETAILSRSAGGKSTALRPQPSA